MGGIRWSWRQLHPSERVETWERRQLHVSGACCATAARAEGHDMGVELLRLRPGYVWAGFTEVGVDPPVARARLPGAPAQGRTCRGPQPGCICATSGSRCVQSDPVGRLNRSQYVQLVPV